MNGAMESISSHKVVMNPSIAVLSICGIVNSFSFMVVAPSILFYVLQNGGNKEQYGIILSAYSFGCFLTKPFMGCLSDKTGFRTPLVGSLAVAAVGSALYTLSSAFDNGTAALSGILVSRLLMGIGGANNVLGYAYVARAVPHEEQTFVIAVLSMGRIVGMAGGPALNIALDYVHLELFGGEFILDPLNCVGVLMCVLNVVCIASVCLFLEDMAPAAASEKLIKDVESNSSFTGMESLPSEESFACGDEAKTKYSFLGVLSAVMSADIVVPFFSLFAFNANFQLVETGLSPAMSDGLGWGSSKISTSFGSLSLTIALGMIIVSKLSKMKITNVQLLVSGLVLSIVAYTLMYFFWVRNAPAWRYILPLVLGALSFPFLAVPTQTIFTIAVDSKPELIGSSGMMQAILSMWGSVAGFIVPSLVAQFCVKTPEEVDASAPYHREMTHYCLFAPLLSLLTLIGVLYMCNFDLNCKENFCKQHGGGSSTSSDDKNRNEIEIGRQNNIENQQHSQRRQQWLNQEGTKNNEKTPLLLREASSNLVCNNLLSKPNNLSSRSRSYSSRKNSRRKLMDRAGLVALRQSVCEVMAIPQPSSFLDDIDDDVPRHRRNSLSWKL